MDKMAVVLPMFCFAIMLKIDDFRESFLKAAIVIGFFVALSTTILGQFDSIAFTPLLFSWLLFFLSLLAWRYRTTTIRQTVTGIATTSTQKILVALLICVAGTAGITAVVAAPNNFDSLTYHLPRIMHWIQNGNVEHFPTNIDRQLALAPFSEFVIMHLQILYGDDRFANCVQWFSMVGSAIGVSLIARALKGSFNSQLVAAALSVSVPMGLLQATSTQNDYAVTFWLVCLTYYIIKTKECSDSKLLFFVGLSLALAIFTKGTAYLVAAPFMLVYLWRLKSKGIKTAVTHLLVISVLILIINGSHYARNIEVFGDPISPGSNNSIISSKVNVSSAVSGVTKNIATQLETTYEGASEVLLVVTDIIHKAIGVDPNDPDLTVDGDFYIVSATVHEDFAPNPLHMLLMLLGIAVLIVRWKKIAGETKLFAVTSMICFVMLSIGIKWNPFISRYFLPVFIISAPFLSLLCDGQKLRPLVNLCAVVLLLLSFSVLANNEMRPLVGPRSVFVTNRIDQYFMVRPEVKPYFMQLDSTIATQPLTNVGIIAKSGNSWEYLLWVVLRDNGVKYRIEHVDVNNSSASIQLENFSTYYPVRF